MTSAINLTYQSQGGGSYIESGSLGEECNNTNTSTLNCTEGYICVEDGCSSLGGRCITFLDRNVTSCTKCTGDGACAGFSQEFIDNNIGEGS